MIVASSIKFADFLLFYAKYSNLALKTLSFLKGEIDIIKVRKIISV